MSQPQEVKVHVLEPGEKRLVCDLRSHIYILELGMEKAQEKLNELRRGLYQIQRVCSHSRQEEFNCLDVAEMKTRRRCLDCHAIL